MSNNNNDLINNLLKSLSGNQGNGNQSNTPNNNGTQNIQDLTNQISGLANLVSGLSGVIPQVAHQAGVSVSGNANGTNAAPNATTNTTTMPDLSGLLGNIQSVLGSVNGTPSPQPATTTSSSMHGSCNLSDTISAKITSALASGSMVLPDLSGVNPNILSNAASSATEELKKDPRFEGVNVDQILASVGGVEGLIKTVNNNPDIQKLIPEVAKTMQSGGTPSYPSMNTSNNTPNLSSEEGAEFAKSLADSIVKNILGSVPDGAQVFVHVDSNAPNFTPSTSSNSTNNNSTNNNAQHPSGIGSGGIFIQPQVHAFTVPMNGAGNDAFPTPPHMQGAFPTPPHMQGAFPTPPHMQGGTNQLPDFSKLFSNINTSGVSNTSVPTSSNDMFANIAKNITENIMRNNNNNNNNNNNSGSTASTTPTGQFSASQTALVAMGYPNREKNQKALLKANGNFDLAVAYLKEDNCD